jgi:hypothetical protein
LSCPRSGRVVCNNLRPVCLRLRHQSAQHSFWKTATEGVANAARPETGERTQCRLNISQFVKERSRLTGRTAQDGGITGKVSRENGYASITREVQTGLSLIQDIG